MTESFSRSLRQQCQVVLHSGAEMLGVPVTAEQEQGLLNYLQLLSKWNTAYNLTAVHDPLQMVFKHLLDSLTILPYVKAPRVLDVGTGAGLPGIPLAITLPDQEFVLLDSNGKKTRFVQQAKLELALENVTVINERVEVYQSEQGFGSITSRAYSSLADMVRDTRHLLADSGQWLAMKGRDPEAEVVDLPDDVHAKAKLLQVPGLVSFRHLVLMGVKTQD